MPWEKEISREDNGAVAKFWDIISLAYSKRTGNTELLVGGWVDQEANALGLEPLTRTYMTIPGGTNPQLGVAVSAFGAGYALAQPQFEGAQVL